MTKEMLEIIYYNKEQSLKKEYLILILKELDKLILILQCILEDLMML